MTTIDEALAVLEAVCRGEVTATPRETPKEIYAGDVVYDLSNGWQVIVFNDCGEWDYVDSMTSPDGTRFESFPEDYNQDPLKIAWWQPKCETATDDGGCAHWGEYY